MCNESTCEGCKTCRNYRRSFVMLVRRLRVSPGLRADVAAALKPAEWAILQAFCAEGAGRRNAGAEPLEWAAQRGLVIPR